MGTSGRVSPSQYGCRNFQPEILILRSKSAKNVPEPQSFVQFWDGGISVITTNSACLCEFHQPRIPAHSSPEERSGTGSSKCASPSQYGSFEFQTRILILRSNSSKKASKPLPFVKLWHSGIPVFALIPANVLLNQFPQPWSLVFRVKMAPEGRGGK